MASEWSSRSESNADSGRAWTILMQGVTRRPGSSLISFENLTSVRRQTPRGDATGSGNAEKQNWLVIRHEPFLLREALVDKSRREELTPSTSRTISFESGYYKCKTTLDFGSPLYCDYRMSCEP